MKIAPQELLGLLVATSFAAGLNVYAAVATLGLLAHAGVLPLPPALEIVSNWWVIGASGVLFLVEFFADKVPAFDLIWNALHTFVRIPVAALLAYGATTQFSPQKQMLATVVGGVIAFAAHGGKTAVRAAVTPSPGAYLECGSQHWRRRASRVSHLVRHATSVHHDWHRCDTSDHYCRDGSFYLPRFSKSVSRRRGGVGSLALLELH